MDNLKYLEKNDNGINNLRFANIFNHNSVAVNNIQSVVKTVRHLWT